MYYKVCREEFRCSPPHQGVVVPSAKPEHGGPLETIDVGMWSGARTEGTSIARLECCYIVSAGEPSASLKGGGCCKLMSKFN